MKNNPMRTCVGCREVKPKKELIRIVSYKDEIKVDATGKANGRGVYVCPDEKCIRDAAKKNAIQRSLSTSIDKEKIEEIISQVREVSNGYTD